MKSKKTKNAIDTKLDIKIYFFCFFSTLKTFLKTNKVNLKNIVFKNKTVFKNKNKIFKTNQQFDVKNNALLFKT